MKARMQFEAMKVGLPIMQDWPIVRRSDGNFANKTALTAFINSYPAGSGTDTALAALCSCGVITSWVTEGDIPASDCTCSCGRYLIKYGS